jgi:hypothetical protein
MLLAIGERHDDVHHRRRQRQEPFDLFSVTHVTTMTTLDLLCQKSTEKPFSRFDAYPRLHVPFRAYRTRSHNVHKRATLTPCGSATLRTSEMPPSVEQIGRSGAARLYGAGALSARSVGSGRASGSRGSLPLSSEPGGHGHNRAQIAARTLPLVNPSARCGRYAGARDLPLPAASWAQHRGSSRDPYLSPVMLYRVGGDPQMPVDPGLCGADDGTRTRDPHRATCWSRSAP